MRALRRLNPLVERDHHQLGPATVTALSVETGVEVIDRPVPDFDRIGHRTVLLSPVIRVYLFHHPNLARNSSAPPASALSRVG